ncbi:DUF488 domain-containing protein [Oceanobacillus sp. J11TS1]|uniref:DUF488 domain-containing protein n=1 Tax=Oceanobacillus sp. J11TS1 TaxID=2807191 RepID=UPI001B044EE6|nr:DUF488 family protein [Oceanobacillus sp. J11TS1]GIO24646.1 hypothetical protein J11TS1_32270 [Oceanobacillus sp. J11TS1]
MSIVLQRIYEKSKESGYRVLVDLVWPRGVSKKEAKLDDWAKEVTPTPSLRKWFNHDPEKFPDFKAAYKKELLNDDEKIKKLTELQELQKEQTLILLYAAKDKEHNHALILKEVLESELPSPNKEG